jgi:hypothetical protein
MKRLTLRVALLVVTLVLAVVLPACSAWGESDSDAVRRAVIAHELDEPGVQVDDLIIRLSPREFRADFGRGPRIVWLVSSAYERPYREGEYFRLRDPELSYLFVQDVTFDPPRTWATVGVHFYAGSGKPTSKEVSLHKENEHWRVTSERALEEEKSG